MIDAVIVLGVIGLIAGSGLAFASKYFHVVKDERIELVKDMLSGANCGGCGYAGCAALAKAICAGEAPVSLCIALKDDEIKNISQLLGLKSSESIKKKAYIRCSGGINCQNRYEYFGPNDCLLMSQYDGGIKSCKYGCVGGGTCEKACPFNAIFVNENGFAEVDYENIDHAAYPSNDRDDPAYRECNIKDVVISGLMLTDGDQEIMINDPKIIEKVKNETLSSNVIDNFRIE